MIHIVGNGETRISWNTEKSVVAAKVTKPLPRLPERIPHQRLAHSFSNEIEGLQTWSAEDAWLR